VKDHDTWSDLEDEMGRKRLDERSADRLIAGLTTADDAPPGYAGVAELLRAARTAPPATLARETMSVARMKAAIAELPVPAPVTTPEAGPLAATRRRTWRNVVRSGTARATAATAALLLVGATGAAAATGTLPAPAQEATRDVLAHLSVNVPAPAVHHHGSPSGTAPPAVVPASGPNAHATFGLCTASVAADGHPATESAIPVTPSLPCRRPDGTIATGSPAGQSDTAPAQPGLDKPSGTEDHSSPSTSAPSDHAGDKTPAQPPPASPDHSTSTIPRDGSGGRRSSTETSVTDAAPTVGHP